MKQKPVIRMSVLRALCTMTLIAGIFAGQLWFVSAEARADDESLATYTAVDIYIDVKNA